MEFFIACMDLFEVDLLAIIKESRFNGRIIADFNSNFISLIPNVDNVKKLEGFKPISLWDCIYKLIAKLVERRMKNPPFWLNFS